jgi:hypothetical protein
MTHEQKIQQVRILRPKAREAGAEVAVSMKKLDRLEESHAELLSALENILEANDFPLTGRLSAVVAVARAKELL